METCKLVIGALYPAHDQSVASAVLIFSNGEHEQVVVGVEGVILKDNPVTIELPRWCKPGLGLQRGELGGGQIFEYELKESTSEDPYTVLWADRHTKSRWQIGDRNVVVYLGEEPTKLKGIYLK